MRGHRDATCVVLAQHSPCSSRRLRHAAASRLRHPQPGRPRRSEALRSDLLGLTRGELVGEFGTPALQVREGTSLKLQFRRPACVLDAYLYPSGADRRSR